MCPTQRHPQNCPNQLKLNLQLNNRQIKVKFVVGCRGDPQDLTITGPYTLGGVLLFRGRALPPILCTMIRFERG